MPLQLFTTKGLTQAFDGSSAVFDFNPCTRCLVRKEKHPLYQKSNAQT